MIAEESPSEVMPAFEVIDVPLSGRSYSLFSFNLFSKISFIWSGVLCGLVERQRQLSVFLDQKLFHMATHLVVVVLLLLAVGAILV